jgi:hypothetical protein
VGRALARAAVLAAVWPALAMGGCAAKSPARAGAGPRITPGGGDRARPSPTRQTVAAPWETHPGGGWTDRLTPPLLGAERLRAGRPVRLASARPFLTRAGLRFVAPAPARRGILRADGSLRALIAQRARRLAPCFVRARGVVHLRLTIGSTGRIGRLWARGTASGAVRRCVTQRVRRWSFGPQTHRVEHRLTLRAMGEAI